MVFFSASARGESATAPQPLRKVVGKTRVQQVVFKDHTDGFVGVNDIQETGDTCSAPASRDIDHS
eukprot:7171904-Karenia_brevis.AAC.1